MIMKRGSSCVSRRKNLFWRLFGRGSISRIQSGTPGWIKRLIMFSTGVIRQRPIWKTGGAALPIISARMQFVHSLRQQNWLFSSSVDGANAGAVVYTMVEMAKAHDLNIYSYLKFLLEHRPTKEMTDDQLAELAPWSEKLQSIKNRM